MELRTRHATVVLLWLTTSFAAYGQQQFEDRRRFFDENQVTTDDPRRIPMPNVPRGPEGTTVLRGGRLFDGTGTAAPAATLVLERNKVSGAASELRAGTPAAFLRTEFMESFARLSPDGKWLAYISDESGEVELYVRSFPLGAGKRKISTGFARDPHWSPGGRELFYFSGPVAISTLMSVAVTRAIHASPDGLPIFETEVPKEMFRVRANGFHPATGTSFYAVSADGERFLINHVDSAEEPVLKVVVNWQQAFGISEKR